MLKAVVLKEKSLSKLNKGVACGNLDGYLCLKEYYPPYG
jgi:hypothetical protein